MRTPLELVRQLHPWNVEPQIPRSAPPTTKSPEPVASSGDFGVSGSGENDGHDRSSVRNRPDVKPRVGGKSPEPTPPRSLTVTSGHDQAQALISRPAVWHVSEVVAGPRRAGDMTMPTAPSAADPSTRTRDGRGEAAVDARGDLHHRVLTAPCDNTVRDTSWSHIAVNRWARPPTPRCTTSGNGWSATSSTCHLDSPQPAIRSDGGQAMGAPGQHR
jgi:hypothetical protein